MDTASATLSSGGGGGAHSEAVSSGAVSSAAAHQRDGSHQIGSAEVVDSGQVGSPDADLAAAEFDDGTGLARRDREILAFERQWWKYSGVKEQAIRELFEMSATRYYQVVNALIDDPHALAADPMLVKRLRRLRTDRQRKRSARRLGIDV